MTAAAVSQPRRGVRLVAVRVFVVVWLLVQLGVPAIGLIDRGDQPRPRLFSWQMFSYDRPSPAESFTVITADGEERVPLRSVALGPFRREVTLAPRVVAVLCERPGVVAVGVVDVETGRSETACA